MNWLIVSAMRSGSTWLGEALALAGLSWFSELFTPEICRRSRIWSKAADQAVSMAVIDQVLAAPGSGLKLIYGQARPPVWARLALEPIRIVHLVREDLLESYASRIYLERTGVSCVRRRGEGLSFWNTAGDEIAAPGEIQVEGDPAAAAAWAESMRFWSQAVRYLYADAVGSYLEVASVDLFAGDGLARVCAFLGVAPAGLPDHVPTPRPRAAGLFVNCAAIAEAIR